MAATLCFFGAIRTIPLADAIALIFFDAVIIVLLSAFFFHEKVPVGRIIASLVGLGGVILVVQPGFGEFYWESLLALVAALFFALYFLSTRFLTGNTSGGNTCMARRGGIYTDESAGTDRLGDAQPS